MGFLIQCKNMTNIILVDEQDNQIGTEEKIKAHQENKLHRAISVFVFNSKNELLLQQRAKAKYHCGGLWSNTCCTHPSPGETVLEAATRRLGEEMGFECPLKEVFSFIYQVDFDNGLSEHEYDHVFIGQFDGQVVPNPEEADSYKWVSLKDLQQDIKNNPQDYTYWFKIALEKLIPYLIKTNQ